MKLMLLMLVANLIVVMRQTAATYVHEVGKSPGGHRPMLHLQLFQLVRIKILNEQNQFSMCHMSHICSQPTAWYQGQKPSLDNRLHPTLNVQQIASNKQSRNAAVTLTFPFTIRERNLPLKKKQDTLLRLVPSLQREPSYSTLSYTYRRLTFHVCRR